MIYQALNLVYESDWTPVKKASVIAATSSRTISVDITDVTNGHVGICGIGNNLGSVGIIVKRIWLSQ